MRRVVAVVALGAAAWSSPLVGVAEASHCGTGEFSVSGTFTDKLTGEPAEVVATVGFSPITYGSITVPPRFTTSTQLPDSTYEICLPAIGDDYGVWFTAPGYVTPRGDFDVWVSPTPASGQHIVVDEAQAKATDLFQTELFFYRDDALYRAYDPRIDGTLPSPIIAGDEWPDSGKWQFSYMPMNVLGSSPAQIMFAYRSGDGAMYAQANPVEYHNSGFSPSGRTYLGDEPGWDVVTPIDSHGFPALLFYAGDGSYQLRGFGTCLGCESLIFVDDVFLSGSDFTPGWTAIVPIDIDGDRDDELLFYRASDGLFRYYHVHQGGRLTEPILAGDGYTAGWTSITAVDLDGDDQDEIMFYRDDGLFRFYDIRPDATLPSPTLAGDGYTAGWDSITRFESCLILGDWECPFSG